jgi:NADPH:quinone reductase-like Zn-dependent oxidoreductase
MKNLEITGAYGLENLQIVERPEVEPGPFEVAVRMKAVSLNFRDLLTVLGTYGGNHPLPLVPFSCGVGMVEAVGPGVTRVAVGDRVSSLFFRDWHSGRPTQEKLATSIGGPLPGCGRQLAIFSEQGVSKVPAHLSDDQVATLPCAALTAWRSLVVEGDLKAGDTVLLQGTGGVSIFALQFAKAMGCEVIITSSSDEKLERAKAMGADHTINYANTPAWGQEATRITGGRGVDHVVEVGGAKTLAQSLMAIRVGGHVSIIGVLSGAAEPLMVPMLIWKAARMVGLAVGSREQYEDMCRAIDLHKISPVIGEVFPMADAKKALEHMQAGKHFGKIVVRMDG